MTRNWDELQTILEELAENKNVYFQPPSNVSMNYPAIVYSRNNIMNEHANNSVYLQYYLYQVVVIDKSPDSKIAKKVSRLPCCKFNTHYKSDNLNHDVFTLYF